MRGSKRGLSFVVSIGLLAGSTATVTAQGAEPPTEITGSLTFGRQILTGAEERVDGVVQVRGRAFTTPPSQMSDPRLDGTWTRTNNIDMYDDPEVWAWQSNWRVVTEEGAWEGIETPVVFSDGSRSTTTAVLVGEDGYAGLTAIIEFEPGSSGWDVRGVIIDGEIPPPPASAAE